jgi:N-acetyl-anhydromuramyl-L-alanine amidase AmpD
LEAQIAELRKYSTGVAGAIKPPVHDVVDLLPKQATKRYPSRALTDIKQIVIHHTATSPTITPQRLAEHQVQKQKKPGIAHHFFIAADGEIYETNRLETVSDHARNRSRQSVGVCFPGNFSDAIPTAAQLEAGGRLCAWLLTHLHLSTDKIVGLSEFVSTQSPGTQWLKGQRWKDKLLAEVEAVLEAGGEDQAAVITSLREQLSALEDENARLRLEPGATTGPVTPRTLEIIDALSDLITSLQGQTNTLHREVSRIETALQSAGPDQSAKIKSLERQIGDLQREKQDLRSEMEAALQAQGDDQSRLIASLRSQINTLKDEVRRLQAWQPTQPSTPGAQPVPGKVSQPSVQNLVGKLPRHPTKTYDSRASSDIKTLVVHHSAVPPTVGPTRIASYHVKSLDWPGIGYHYLVADDGVIYQGNAITTASFHAAKVNPRGAGICFLGNFGSKVPPPAQLQAGAHLIAWLMQELDLELDMVKGHQEFMATACPGNQWLKGRKWKQMLRQAVVKVQQEAMQSGASLVSLPGVKSIYHYVLFWHHGDSWAQKDWDNAQDYIATYQPTVGFSKDHAAQAENVTIVGGPLGVPQHVEDWLIAQGCRVDRIAGANEAATKAMLTNLIKKNKRFRSFDE